MSEMPFDRRMPRIVALGALLWCVTAGAEESPRVVLTWNGPPECSDDGEVTKRVDAMLGSTPGALPPAPIVADATAERLADGRWRVTLRTLTAEGRGERTLEDEDCAAIRKATALLLALMIDPTATPLAVTPPPATATPPVPKPTTEAKPSPPAPQPDRGTSFAVGLDGVVDSGTLPAWAGGARLSLGVSVPYGSLELRSAAWLPRTRSSGALSGAGGRFTMAEQAIAICAGSDRTDPVAVRACAGPALVWMRGDGFGVTVPSSASALWPAAFLEGGVLVGVARHLALHAAAGGTAAWAAPKFAIRQVGVIHTPHPFAARAALGLAYRF